MRIGIQLTKDKEKYQNLLSVLKSNLDSKNGLEFFHIGDDNDLESQINNLDILTTYGISENVFSNKSDKLKWINFAAAGIEKSLFSSIIKSKG